MNKKFFHLNEIETNIAFLNESMKQYSEENLGQLADVFELRRMHEVERKLEKSALNFREIINLSTEKKSTDFLCKTSSIFDENKLENMFKIKRIGSVIEIELPPLLHKKNFILNDLSKEEQNQYEEDYYSFKMIDRKLFAFLDDYFVKNHMEKIPYKVLIHITNIVNKNTKKSLIIDTDNHEFYRLINTVSSVFLMDDSFEYVAHLYDTEYGEENKTIVRILPFDKISACISEQMSIPKDNNLFFISNKKSSRVA